MPDVSLSLLDRPYRFSPREYSSRFWRAIGDDKYAFISRGEFKLFFKVKTGPFFPKCDRFFGIKVAPWADHPVPPSRSSRLPAVAAHTLNPNTVCVKIKHTRTTVLKRRLFLGWKNIIVIWRPEYGRWPCFNPIPVYIACQVILKYNILCLLIAKAVITAAVGAFPGNTVAGHTP